MSLEPPQEYVHGQADRPLGDQVEERPHGEGQAEFSNPAALNACHTGGLVSIRYIDNRLDIASRYPANPNGSPHGITGITSRDGRATILMPHPERVFRAVTNSWKPDSWKEDGAWMRLFRNARVFVN